MRRSTVLSLPHSYYSLARNSYWRGRIITVDLLVLISLVQLLFIESIIDVFYKTIYLNEVVNCIEPSPQKVFPGKEFLLKGKDHYSHHNDDRK